VILDLEDAVAPAAKEAARDELAKWLPLHAGPPVVLRINASDTPWFVDDLALCAQAAVAAVMVPKAALQGLEEVARAAAGKALLPLVETAAAFGQLGAIAAADSVARLVFGSVDFQLDMGIVGDGEELLHFRSQLVLLSRLARLDAPVDGVTTALGDDALTEADARRARRLGFGAKLCIHPRQVAIVNTSFSPGEAELAWAHRVVQAAHAANGAATAQDGKMIDKPVLRRVEALLQQARRS
jgi:citrate lyase subunit beta/citryl-CoA lyase